MSFYTEPFDVNSPQGAALARLLRNGLHDIRQVRDFVVSARIINEPLTSVTWETSIGHVWEQVLPLAFSQGNARELILAASRYGDYQAPSDDLRALLQAADAEATREELVASFVRTGENSRVVFGYPFLDRETLRPKIAALFRNERRVLIVHGPRNTGRTHTWFLVQHVALSVAKYRAYKVDLVTDEGKPVVPHDVALQISSWIGLSEETKRELGLDVKADTVAQENTNARTLGYKIIGYLTERPNLCLAFDGLDRNVAPATKALVWNIVEAVLNVNLPNLRVVLLGLEEKTVNELGAYAITDQLPAGIPLVEIANFFTDLGTAVQRPYKPGQVGRLLTSLFGGTPPDPVPVSLLREKASVVSAAFEQRWRGMT